MARKNKAKEIQGIQDLVPDDKNANRGTLRGRGLLEKSLRRLGAGRSILVDKDGRVTRGGSGYSIDIDFSYE
jgi:hypothetical protein